MSLTLMVAVQEDTWRMIKLLRYATDMTDSEIVNAAVRVYHDQKTDVVYRKNDNEPA